MPNEMTRVKIWSGPTMNRHRYTKGESLGRCLNAHRDITETVISGQTFDGDMMHVKMTLSDESIAETKKVLRSKEYYISDKGTLHFSNATDVITAVFKTLS